MIKDIKIEDEANKVTSIEQAGLKLLNKMRTTIEPKNLELIDSQDAKIIEPCLGVIKSGHTNKGLLHRMVAAGEYLGSQRNYQYSLAWTSSFKTDKALKRLGYEMIG